MRLTHAHCRVGRWWSVAALLAVALVTGCSADQPTRTEETGVKDAGDHAKSPVNFLIIVADDLGFADLGFAGSEIRTPTLDTLAQQGTVLTQFYTTPNCSPTRAMLLSGVDHHRAGLGSMHELMSDELREQPGYEGYLNDRVDHLPTQLKALGYRTFMAGKWHLGLTEAQSPAARGFDRSFVMLNGGASHFADRAGLFSMAPIAGYRENGKFVETLPEDFFSSRFYADRIIDYIDEALLSEQPFFGYLAFTAPHWPLQAPADYRDRYAGTYDDGWDVLRARRFAAMKQKGWVPESTTLPPRLPFVEPWASLTPEDQRRRARDMELYAAMVEHMDAQIARVLAHLDKSGITDNTLVLFFADNGPEGTDALTVLGNDRWVPQRFDNSPDNLGGPNSYTSYGPGWAQASATPFNLFKAFPHEGGVRVPAVVRLPKGFTSTPTSAVQSEVNRSGVLISVADIAPTLLALAESNVSPNGDSSGLASKTPVPVSTDGGQAITPLMTGKVINPFLPPHKRPTGNATPLADADGRVLAWELFGRAAVRQREWKAVKLLPLVGDGSWQLFNLSNDPGEQRNVAEDYPDTLNALTAHWWQYASENGVVVMDKDVGYGKR